ncbi:CBS domain-containing protein [Thiomicrospira microaerophila]|uniref:CBS domain-containing protein n=1 Tax=Thiomicrospira microaerophila TaxID=406020 RepID=UPI0005CA6AB2|nr:CBS domain-containing protein [Thiomicrospira microaerophila]
MFVVYSPEGRNFIGGKSDKANPTKVNAITESDFKETMMELDKDLPERTQQHQKASYALGQYQKQLDTLHERHVVVTVSEIMSTKLVTISPEASFSDAWQLMQQHKFHHLPVVDEGSLVGICSSQELLRHVIINDDNRIEAPKGHRIAEIANPEVITTLPNVDVRRVAFMMTEYQIGALPVMSDLGGLIGMVTRADLIKRLAMLPPLEIYV